MEQRGSAIKNFIGCVKVEVDVDYPVSPQNATPFLQMKQEPEYEVNLEPCSSVSPYDCVKHEVDMGCPVSPQRATPSLEIKQEVECELNMDQCGSDCVKVEEDVGPTMLQKVDPGLWYSAHEDSRLLAGEPTVVQKTDPVLRCPVHEDSSRAVPKKASKKANKKASKKANKKAKTNAEICRDYYYRKKAAKALADQKQRELQAKEPVVIKMISGAGRKATQKQQELPTKKIIVIKIIK